MDPASPWTLPHLTATYSGQRLPCGKTFTTLDEVQNIVQGYFEIKTWSGATKGLCS
jgi:hypothetical protein